MSHSLKVRDWETPGRAAVTCWRVLIGEYNYDEMLTVNDSASSFFMITFTFGIVLIMLNMLLSIILETYLDVKRGETEKAETLYSQFMESLGRYLRKRKKERIGLDEVRKRLMVLAKGRYLQKKAGNAGKMFTSTTMATLGSQNSSVLEIMALGITLNSSSKSTKDSVPSPRTCYFVHLEQRKHLGPHVSLVRFSTDFSLS